MSLGRRDFNWFWIIGFGWAIVFAIVLAPASWWFQVNSVRVFDAPFGTSPRMEVSRAINRNFYGEWTVTVMKQGSRGFYASCVATGASDYRPDAVLPDDLDLDWWTWPMKCPLAPGTYAVKTLWVLHLPLFPNKEVRVTSNVFTVR